MGRCRSLTPLSTFPARPWAKGSCPTPVLFLDKGPRKHRMLFSTILLLFVISSIRAAVITRPNDVHDTHEHDVYDKSLPDAWYQDPSHPVHSLFRRAGQDDGTNYAVVGTPGDSSLCVSLALLNNPFHSFRRMVRFIPSDRSHARYVVNAA